MWLIDPNHKQTEQAGDEVRFWTIQDGWMYSSRRIKLTAQPLISSDSKKLTHTVCKMNIESHVTKGP